MKRNKINLMDSFFPEEPEINTNDNITEEVNKILESDTNEGKSENKDTQVSSIEDDVSDYENNDSAINDRAESVFKINEPKVIMNKSTDSVNDSKVISETEIDEDESEPEVPDNLTSILQLQAETDPKLKKSMNTADFLRQVSQRKELGQIKPQNSNRGLHDTRGKKGQFLHRMHLSYTDENYDFVTTYSHYFRMSYTEFINFMIDYFRTHMDEIIGNSDK